MSTPTVPVATSIPLPTEIVATFLPWLDKKTLFYCCIVNNTWFNLAQPFLWKELKIRSECTRAAVHALLAADGRHDTADSPTTSTTVPQPKNPSHLRTQPDPASFVHKLDFRADTGILNFFRFLPRFTRLRDLTIRAPSYEMAIASLCFYGAPKTIRTLSAKVPYMSLLYANDLDDDEVEDRLPYDPIASKRLFSQLFSVSWTWPGFVYLQKEDAYVVVNSAHPSLRAVEFPFRMTPDTLTRFLAECSSELKAVTLNLDPHDLSNLHVLGERGPKLQALKIYIALVNPKSDLGQDTFEEFFRLGGTQLEFLCLTPVVNAAVLDSVSRHCPRLKHVKLDIDDSRMGSFDSVDYSKFFAAIGVQLQSIKIGRKRKDLGDGSFWRLVADTCPNIQRLVVVETDELPLADNDSDLDSDSKSNCEMDTTDCDELVRNVFGKCPKLDYVTLEEVDQSSVMRWVRRNRTSGIEFAMWNAGDVLTKAGPGDDEYSKFVQQFILR
ncbi:hypothetical protein HK102_006646 [Quaeritorhiza haematococci]|nr:hypothetical protein HK102_006646 [Quaeritorhiza haematococci]